MKQIYDAAGDAVTFAPAPKPYTGTGLVPVKPPPASVPPVTVPYTGLTVTPRPPLALPVSVPYTSLPKPTTPTTTLPSGVSVLIAGPKTTPTSPATSPASAYTTRPTLGLNGAEVLPRPEVMTLNLGAVDGPSVTAWAIAAAIVGLLVMGKKK